MTAARKAPMAATVAHRWPGGALVRVTGELDVATADLLRSVLFAEADRDDMREIVLDLGGLRFCDASGLRVLIAAQNRISALGGTLRLTEVRPQMARLLRATHLDEAFQPVLS